MATVLKVAGADFSANAFGFLPPVATGLKAWAFHGTGKSLKNRAEGGVDFSAGGAPTYGANVINLKAGTTSIAEIITSVGDSANLTLFGVISSDDDGSALATQPIWIGNVGTNTGVILFARSTGKDALQWFFSDATSDFVTPANALPGTQPFAPYRFIAATIEAATSTYTLYDKTNGVVTSKVNTKARALGIAGQPFKFGNYYASARQGGSRAVVNGIYDRALSAAEIETLYQYAKSYCGRRGIAL